MRNDFKVYLGEDEVDQFGAWAFGEGFETLEWAIDYMKAWNRLHHLKLKLVPEDSISDDIPKMVDLWRNR